jgi:hypothetical protein
MAAGAAPSSPGATRFAVNRIPASEARGPTRLHLPHCDSDGARAPSHRELARADVVPMHRMQRTRPGGASVGRPQRAPASCPSRRSNAREGRSGGRGEVGQHGQCGVSWACLGYPPGTSRQLGGSTQVSAAPRSAIVAGWCRHPLMARVPDRIRDTYFLGAGFSRSLNLPNTAELLSEVHRLARERGLAIDKHLREAYRYFYPEDLRRSFRRLSTSSPCPEPTRT